MKISTRSITLAATLTALCFVTGFLPYVFFLPVTVAATTLSLGMAAFVGLAFGCVSIAYSFIMPGSMVATAFIQAPYIAILPRIAAAVIAFGAGRLFSRLCKSDKGVPGFLALALPSAIASLMNTALVVGLFMIIMPDMMLGGVTMRLAVPEMLISGAIECVCMAVLTPPISRTLKRTVLLDKHRLHARTDGLE